MKRSTDAELGCITKGNSDIMTMDLSEYQYIAGYGIGQYYDYIKPQLPPELHLDFLCDARFEQIGAEYDGLEVISPDTLKKMQNVFVVVFSGNIRNWQSISGMLDGLHFPYAHIDRVLGGRSTITGRDLKKQSSQLYLDGRGNRIAFFPDIEDSVSVSFLGDNNFVSIGRRVSVGKLRIHCGRNVFCSIGEGTEIEGAEFIATDGRIEVGQDCLFSTEVTLRNHDKHHIFDSNTGERINHSGNIKIGNHVWICHGVTLLGSASVGDNSIVGTMAVTSSTFPKEVILAGNPAKIIRRNVCWSKDNTDYYNRDSLSQCMAQEALKYMARESRD